MKSKKVHGDSGRFRHEKDIPAGSIPCPACKTEMNTRFDAFTCYSAVSGPYLKVTIAFVCAQDDCRYRATVNAHSQDGTVLRTFERLTKDISNHAVIEPSWNRIVRRAGTVLRRRKANSVSVKLRAKR